MVTINNTQALTEQERQFKKIVSCITKQYPTAKSIRLLETLHGYKTMFKIGGIKYISSFSEGGNWIQTQRKIKLSDVPHSIRKTVKIRYPKAQVLSVKEIVSYTRHSPLYLLDIIYEQNISSVCKLYFTSQGILEREEFEPS